MNLPEQLFYHPEHTWVRVEGTTATVGITEFAQDELGDIVFVELPEVGQAVSAGEVFGSLESSKSVSELFSPVDGEVAQVNEALEDAPEMINDDPYGEGWIMRVRVSEGLTRGALLDSAGYAEIIEAK